MEGFLPVSPLTLRVSRPVPPVSGIDELCSSASQVHVSSRRESRVACLVFGEYSLKGEFEGFLQASPFTLRVVPD
jgi:hypothetical protein